MSNNQISTVDFRGHPLTVITASGQQLVAMRPVCEGIGLDWKAQYSRIKRDEVLSSTVVVMTIVAQDGKQREAVCLPLDYLNGWLFGIDVNRCREEIRPALIRYKRECYAVLAAHFQKKEVEYQPSIIHRRWLVAFDHNGREQITPVPDDAYVLSHAKLLKYIADGDSFISTEELFNFVVAATAQLQYRSAYQKRQIGRAREAGFKLD